MKKLFSAALAAVMLALLASCGGPGSSSLASSSVAPPPPPSSGTVSVSVPEPEPLNQAFLTGLAKDVNYPEGKRVTAVMINNAPSARPQNGIGEAKILVEIKVEYGVTRFMALFEDYATMPRVGGLRSARDQFFQLLIPFWGFYVHEGPSQPEHPVNLLMTQYEYRQYDVWANYYPVYTVDSSRSTSQYGWYDVSGESITEYIQNVGLDDYRSYGSPIFNFQPYTEQPRRPAGGSVSLVEVPHVPDYYISYFEYDAASARYAMSMHNSYNGRREATVDNNTGEQLEFDNVIVLFAPFDTYPATKENLPKVDYSNGGVGYYFTQGGWEMLIWRKGPANYPVQLYTADKSETPITVNPGTTYFGVVDDEFLEDYHYMLLDGTMGQSEGGTTEEGPVVD